MANEIEKKYRLGEGDSGRIAEDLDEFGAVYAGSAFEENIIFTGAVLIEINALIRIRTTENQAVLTFKQWVPRAGDLKEHIEYESAIDDPAAVKLMLSSLGFETRLVYEKRRRTWKFRETEVVLDVLPFGEFMEIEGSASKIREVEMILGADVLAHEPETYPLLTERHGQKKGRMFEARF